MVSDAYLQLQKTAGKSLEARSTATFPRAYAERGVSVLRVAALADFMTVSEPVVTNNMIVTLTKELALADMNTAESRSKLALDGVGILCQDATGLDPLPPPPCLPPCALCYNFAHNWWGPPSILHGLGMTEYQCCQGSGHRGSPLAIESSGTDISISPPPLSKLLRSHSPPPQPHTARRHALSRRGAGTGTAKFILVVVQDVKSNTAVGWPL